MRLLSICILVGIETLAVSSSEAMIIRHDVADSEYVVADAGFPALVDLISPGDCIGTLIDPSYLLTVAHCAVDLNVGRSLVVGGVSHAVAEVTLHPRWRDLDEYDIALVRLETPVAGVTPMPIYRGSAELGAVITLVGRGVTATGLVGEPGAEVDGKLRRATNIASAVDDHVIEIIFERDGQPGLTDLEGVGASGDSGCPVFIELDGASSIAGLNSYGETSGDADIGQYGARDYQTRVSRHVEWIDSIVDSAPGTGDPDDDPGTPDPETDDIDAGGCASAGGSSSTGAALALLAFLWCRQRPRAGATRVC